MRATQSRKIYSKFKHGVRQFQAASDSGKDLPAEAIDLLFETVHSAAESTRYIHNARIADKELRSRIDELISVIDVWYQNAQQYPRSVSKERTKSIIKYMGYVNRSIEDYLHDEQLPPYQSPPDPAVENPQAGLYSAGLSELIRRGA